jgi:hypothetical protein
MTRPYTRHRDHAAMAGPATRATTDAILARLHEESPYASMLHEEIPDWLDIERRPTPRPALRPVPPPPKEKAVPFESKSNLREDDREFFREAVAKIGRGALTLAAEECGMKGNTGGLRRWLDTGIGISDKRLDRLMAWARHELAADDPTARVRARWDDAKQRMSEAAKGQKRRGKPHPKTDLEEEARAEVARALERTGRGPCSLSAELFGHTGLANWLKTGKGLGPENVARALEWARQVRLVVSHYANGEAVRKWELVDLDFEDVEDPAFDSQPYPKTTSLSAARDEIKSEPSPDPAAFVLETWAAARLTYAMETLGLTMPEGYRFRVTVEKS